MKPYVTIAYRWGWLNGSHYLVSIKEAKDDAINSAIAECEGRGGKYGVVVYDAAGEVVHYEPSSWGEVEPHINHRIQMFERVGLKVVCALEDNKSLSWEEITAEWQREKKTLEMIEAAVESAKAHTPQARQE